jgi:hypothetical protein
MDATPTADNGVAGVNLGGCAAATNGYAYLTSPTFDGNGPGNVEIHFQRWLQSDYAPYMTNRVEVYDGASWTVLWETGGSPGVKDLVWQSVAMDITAYKSAQMRVRFGYAVTSMGFYPVGSWNIDDVNVTGVCP